MNTTADPKVTYGDIVTVGHSGAYHGALPKMREAHIADYTYLVGGGGKFYATCGYCDYGVRTEFLHVDNGICFRCFGSGHGKLIGTEADVIRHAKQRAARARRAAAKREAEAERRLAELATKQAAWDAAHPEAAAIVAAVEAMQEDGATSADAIAKYGETAFDIAYQGASVLLTDAQADLMVKAYAEHQAKLAKAAESRYMDVDEKAKVTATGTVVVYATYESNYGYTSTLNALVVIELDGEHEGVTVKTTGTGQTLYGWERGDRVTVTGTVKKFEEYQGTKQTVLTRAKLTELVAD